MSTPARRRLRIPDVFSSAPRYLYKYARRTYYPLDKDIVREMWVQGDLKSQLGLGPRNKFGSRSESISLFKKGHHSNDSEMELHSTRRYEPTPTRDPLSPPQSQDWGAVSKESVTTQYPLQPPISHPISGRSPSPATAGDRYSYYSATEIPSPLPGTPVDPRSPHTPSTPRPVHLDPAMYDARAAYHQAQPSASTYETAPDRPHYDAFGDGEESPHAV